MRFSIFFLAMLVVWGALGVAASANPDLAPALKLYQQGKVSEAVKKAQSLPEDDLYREIFLVFAQKKIEAFSTQDITALKRASKQGIAPASALLARYRIITRPNGGAITQARIALMDAAEQAYSPIDGYLRKHIKNGRVQAVVRGVQERLKKRGLLTGTVDGVYGDQTSQALKRYAKPKTLAKMDLQLASLFLGAKAGASSAKAKTKNSADGSIPHWGVRSKKITKSRKHLSKKGNRICAISIDDGPIKAVDSKFLDVLKKHNVKVSFFLVANLMPGHGRLIKRMVKEGHEIEYHSYRHALLGKKSKKQIQADFKKGLAVFKKFGIKPKLFRPPGGILNRDVIRVAKAHGMETVLWTHDPKDALRVPYKKVLEAYYKKYKTGDLTILHSTNKSSPRALDTIIPWLKKHRCDRFVTTRQWVNMVTG